jgi:hypothetical protein
VKWTHQRGLSPKLVVPTTPRQQPAKLLDDDERWRLLHRRLSVHADRRPARWLFPGLVPGRPTANHALTTRLSRHDINVRIARNGALAALAADLPAAVLADLLGMHINTSRAMGQVCRTRLGRLHSGPCH